MYKLIEESFDRQVEALRGLIRIPSVSRGTPEEGMPFGRHVYDALTYTLDLARDLGFTTVFHLDGYCGVVEYGEGEEMVGVMAHLDVVPEGTGWNYPPYGAVLEDGRIYGRGTMDDKGAAISALFALAAIKDSGVKLKRRVRLIFGCDEERGSSCIKHYKESQPEPDMAFTPDAEYPVVNSEMGILHTSYSKKYSSKLNIKVGTAANVIPGDVEAELPFEPVPTALHEGFTADWGTKLAVHGMGGHAAYPQLAHNALTQLIDLLAAQDALEAEDAELVCGLAKLIGMNMHGEGLGVDITDDSGRTTLNMTMFELNENGAKFSIDCRYPFSLPYETLIERVDSGFAKLGLVRGETSNSLCHYIAPDSYLVSTLMDIFNKNTGRNLKPLAIGGGTYARAFKNAVAFGPEPLDTVSLMHMPNEYICLSDMRFNTRIMTEAIYRLAAEN